MAALRVESSKVESAVDKVPWRGYFVIVGYILHFYGYLKPIRNKNSNL